MQPIRVRMELWQVCDSQDLAQAQLTKGLTNTNDWAELGNPICGAAVTSLAQGNEISIQ